VGHTSRREFLRTFAVASTAAGASFAFGKGKDAPFDHVVVVMMENRSFDHMLGWLPNADGRQAGLTYYDLAGAAHSTYPLAPDFQGCGHPDPDHSYEGGRIEYNGGACDGWLRAGQNDEYAIGYYTAQDLAFFSAAVPYWATSDRYFSAIMAETIPNRLYQHSAQTDRVEFTFDQTSLPTIWDRLADAGLTGRYYYSDIPMLALWGSKYVGISRLLPQFLADAAAGTLPEVSFVDPRFLGELEGLSNDDHPHADIRNGQAFLNLIYTAVSSGPAWERTVFVINYDEWGGFFDHVPPGYAPDRVRAHALRGFRVPLLVISPWARRGVVSHTTFDHASVLKMIEWRWGLNPLAPRDAAANNLAELLDFTAPDLTAPVYPVPAGPFGTACLNAAGAPALASVQQEEWYPLKELADRFGFPLG
jgi:phospholipase C